MFSKLTKEDFAINYTCRAYSARGTPVAYFTLMPTGKAPITAQTFLPNLPAIPALNRLKQSASSSARKPWRRAPPKLVPTGVIFISADPDLILPIGVVLGGVSVLFVLSVSIYYIFKVEIVLWFRSAFPVLYIDKGNSAFDIS